MAATSRELCTNASDCRHSPWNHRQRDWSRELYFFGLNTVAAIGTMLCSVISGFSAIRALSNENTPAARIPLRLAAVFGAVAALLSLVASFTGYESHALSEQAIISLQNEVNRHDLTDTQLEMLTQLLTSVPKPADPVHLTSLPNDEAKVLAGKLKRALISAGFTTDGVWDEMVLAESIPTIVIRQKSKNGLVGTGIAKALMQVGLKPKIVPTDALPESRVEILVDYQP